MGTQSNFQMRVLSVLSLAVVASSAPHGWQQVGKTGASNCDYVSDKVTYYDTDSIGPDGPVYVGNTSLPSRLQGVFWLVNDGGDALVSFGAPPGGDPQAECNNGRLVQDGSAYCATVSTVRPGGWTFQALAHRIQGSQGDLSRPVLIASTEHVARSGNSVLTTRPSPLHLMLRRYHHGTGA